jgi:hypothetical protein
MMAVPGSKFLYAEPLRCGARESELQQDRDQRLFVRRIHVHLLFFVEMGVGGDGDGNPVLLTPTLASVEEGGSW